MILTIMKQTTQYYLEEKEFEIAAVYADLYCKMVIQYLPKKDQALAALKDLAYDFYNIGHYRSAKKYFLEVKKNFDISSLTEKDLILLAETEEKLGCLDQAIIAYERLIRFHPDSIFVTKSYQEISRIYRRFNNRFKAKSYLRLSKSCNQFDNRQLNQAFETTLQ